MASGKNRMMNSEINSENLSDADLQALIHQLEFKKTQLELGARFERNMGILKTEAPEIYQHFVNYEANELQLILEDDGSINLANIKLNNRRYYSYNAEDFCRDQVNEYVKHPFMTDLKFGEHKNEKDYEMFTPIYNDLLTSYKKLDIKLEPNLDVPIGLLLVVGCGLGFHLIELIRKLDIVNLCLVEPHTDSFYAALHVIELDEIYEYFNKKNGVFKLYLGPEQVSAEPIITTLVDEIGLHNCVHTLMYSHFDSEEEKQFTESYYGNYHLSHFGLGFFDDERVGLAHTMSHLGKSFKLFDPGKIHERLPPAFIVGNGPSLDELLPLLEREKDNAIIFSAGTTLGSLYKAGIKPDFHVEQERVALVSDWISAGSDDDYRKGIVALGLNTVHPDSLKYFERVGFAGKPNDIGVAVLNSLLTDDFAKVLPYCNPTVSNCTLAYALCMGFREIYFIGVDMGTADDGRHHSELSLYTSIEEKVEGGIHISYVDENETYRVAGNFTETVSTNPILDKSRQNLELLLKMFRIDAYNPNNGAKISGAAAVRQDDINIPAFKKSKQALVSELFERHFTTVGNDKNVIDAGVNDMLRQFVEIRPKLELKKHPKNIDEAAGELSRVYSYIRSLEASAPLSMHLLRGSVNILFALMYKSFIFAKDTERFEQGYRLGWETYNLFLEKAYWTMENSPFVWDDTKDTKLAALLNQSE